MIYEFKLPDIGEGLTEGEVTKWHVKAGDAVSENQPLCSVLTDKAEVEIPSPKNGKIVKLFAKPGEKVKVHETLVSFELSGGNGATETRETTTTKTATTKTNSAPSQAPTAGPGASGSGYIFNLPDIGEGLTEGEVTKWHVKVGDAVTENQPLANVLTDKAEVEVPSPKSGRVLKLYAKAGEKVKVHGPLVEFELVGGKGTAQTKTQATTQTVKTEKIATPSRAHQAGSGVAATPMVRQMAKKLGIDINLIAGTGPDGRVLEKDLKSAGNGSTTANATPAVKKLAAELGVDLGRVQGTGPGGRVAEWDVRQAAPAAKPSGAPAAAVPAQARPAALPASAGPEERVPFVGIRRKIAEKMAQSAHAVAAVTHMEECDMTALVALREELKKQALKKGVKLTYLPFIIRALTKALKEFPFFNAALDELNGEIVKRLYYNVGIAVNAGQGLVVPNIKGADGKDVWALAGEVQALAERVRAGKIDVPSLQGGTFTITNIGPMGGLFATPIVNHPEIAILGLMKLQKRPMVRDGKIEIRDMMNLVLTFDHRVVDGADGAQFINTLIKHLENPRTLL